MSQEQVREWWSRNPMSYDVGDPILAPPGFTALRGKRVLEVGCGSGFAVQLFAEAGADTTAVDLTDWAVETTRTRLAASTARSIWCCASRLQSIFLLAARDSSWPR